MKKRVLCLLAVFTAVVILLFPVSADDSKVGSMTVTLEGSVKWDDSSDAKGKRPSKLGLVLYADGQEKTHFEVKAENGWEYSIEYTFENGKMPAFSVQAEQIDLYQEVKQLHVDPTADFAYPSKMGWTKYEPCNKLEIPMSKLDNFVIAGKMTKHRPLVIWTYNELDADKQKLVEASVRGNPGVGNPPSAVFLHGFGQKQYGMTIDAENGKIIFDNQSDWSLLFGGNYELSKTKSTRGMIIEQYIASQENKTDNKGTTPDKGTESKDPSPQTGCYDMTGLYFLLCILSACGVVYIKRKKA